VVRAVVAGLLIVEDLRDFYGYKGLALDPLHRETGAKRRLHLGCQAAEVLLKLARVVHAHDLEAGVLVQAEEQYAASCAVGEGGKGLEEIGGGACVSCLGFHAIELSVAAAKVRIEAED
jgi:hypothetical protein